MGPTIDGAAGVTPSSSFPSTYLLSLPTSTQSVYVLNTPSTSRNAVETELPMIPPTELKEPKRSEIEAEDAATTRQVTMTILERERGQKGQ